MKRTTLKNILITGGEQIDRMSYAVRLAQELLCRAEDAPCATCIHCQRVQSYTHPNLAVVSPSRAEDDDAPNSNAIHDGAGTIKIEQIRRIVTESNKACFEEGVGVFIITHMHHATTSAANALLKTIEERHGNRVFIALAPSRSSVLPTIASRLANYTIKPSLQNSAYDEKNRDTIIKISGTAPSKRFDMCTIFSAERESLTGELHELSHTCHLMLRNKGIPYRLALGILEAIQSAQYNLEKNLNTRLVVEQLVLCHWPLWTKNS